MNKRSIVNLLVVLCAGPLSAQTPVIPPDYFGDTLPAARYRVNDGQVIDTDGQL